jgi:hypothetical protein
LKLEKIIHGFKTLAECGGIRGVDDTSSLLFIDDVLLYQLEAAVIAVYPGK